jgi:hypothetical protein
MNFLFLTITNAIPLLVYVGFGYWILSVCIRKWGSEDQLEKLPDLRRGSAILAVSMVGISAFSVAQMSGPRVELRDATVTYTPERRAVEEQTQGLTGPQEEWRGTFEDKIHDPEDQ